MVRAALCSGVKHEAKRSPEQHDLTRLSEEGHAKKSIAKLRYSIDIAVDPLCPNF